ncbi:hypothetical protein SNEBB_006297 [Seison nebaliae]|nr:hypothetical protein SNEBB_006297 [Seison nebaliae]
MKFSCMNKLERFWTIQSVMIINEHDDRHIYFNGKNCRLIDEDSICVLFPISIKVPLSINSTNDESDDSPEKKETNLSKNYLSKIINSIMSNYTELERKMVEEEEKIPKAYRMLIMEIFIISFLVILFCVVIGVVIKKKIVDKTTSYQFGSGGNRNLSYAGLINKGNDS